MNIDEAIKHAEEKAEELRQEAKTWTNDGWQKAFIGLTPEKEVEFFEERQKEHDTCIECANEYEQLADWLKELKKRRETMEMIKKHYILVEKGVRDNPDDLMIGRVMGGGAE